MSKSNRSASDIHVSYPVEAAKRIKPLSEADLGNADDCPWRSDRPGLRGDGSIRVQHRDMRGLVCAVLKNTSYACFN